MRDATGLFLIVLMTFVGFMSGKQYERAEDARWAHIRPAYPIKYEIHNGKLRENLTSKFDVVLDTGLPDHPSVAIDSNKFVWIESTASYYDCEKCHAGRWNVSSGSPVHVQRLGWIKNLGIAPVLPEKPPNQEVEDERLKSRSQGKVPEA